MPHLSADPTSPLDIGGSDLQSALTDGERLRRSRQLCEQLTRRRARNFYYGIRLTPKPKRSAMYAIYAWTRSADDLADGTQDSLNSVEEAADQLLAFRDLTQAAVVGDFTGTDEWLRVLNPEICHPFIWPALADAVNRFSIPESNFLQMIVGQLDDLETTERRTFSELYTYCNRVASSVGRMCLAVWGHDETSEVLQLAEWRGVALQLTNILRDFREDFDRGRVYLPQDELREHELTAEDLYEGRHLDRCRSFLEFQVERTREFFEKCTPLESHISPDCVPTSLGIFLVYRRLFDRIADDPMIVLRDERVSLSRMEKLKTAMHALRARRRSLRRAHFDQVEDGRSGE